MHKAPSFMICASAGFCSTRVPAGGLYITMRGSQAGFDVGSPVNPVGALEHVLFP